MPKSQMCWTILIFTACFNALGSLSAQRTLPERVQQSGGKPVETGILSEIYPRSVEELTAEAAAVVLATLSKTKSYLSPNREQVYTDYSMSIGQLVAGVLEPIPGQPGVVTAPTLTVYGGEITIEGTPVRAINHSFGAISDGSYLLFLRRFGSEAGRYQIHNGGVFRIDGDTVRPMVRRADQIFPDLRDARTSTLIERIGNARKN